MKNNEKLLPVLELQNIEKIYKNSLKGGIDVKVLDDINFKIYPGEFISIVGQSGSGKTTLLNVCSLIDGATSGKILYSGVETAKLSDEEIAQFRNKNIGFIFQFHFLLTDFTVLDNVLIPTWIRAGQDTSIEKEEAIKILKFVGLEDQIYKRATQLSGGQQQRVAIARALINRPKIIYADEPTGNLDSASSKNIYNLLRNINEEFNTTIVIVTHDSKIADQCDRKIVISDGKIAN